MVLAGEDDAAEPGPPELPHPLPRVEVGGEECAGAVTPRAPLAVGKRVHAEVDEGRELLPLPPQLPLRGDDTGRLADDLVGRVGRKYGNLVGVLCPKRGGQHKGKQRRRHAGGEGDTGECDMKLHAKSPAIGGIMDCCD